jgi:hypothetical protein
MTTNPGVLYTNSTSTGFAVSSDTILNIVSAKNKRGPYKKGTFQIEASNLPKVEVMGKVKALAKLGELLDNLKEGDTITLDVTKL